jgi:hypothetical protein
MRMFKNPLAIFIFYLSRERVLKPGPDAFDDFRHRPSQFKRLDLTLAPPRDPGSTPRH